MGWRFLIAQRNATGRRGGKYVFCLLGESLADAQAIKRRDQVEANKRDGRAGWDSDTKVPSGVDAGPIVARRLSLVACRLSFAWIPSMECLGPERR